MKILLTIVLFMLSPPLLAGETEKEEEPAPTSEELRKIDRYNRIKEKDSILEKMLEDPRIKPRYQTCQEEQKKNVNQKFDMGKCIWDGEGAAGLSPLSDGEKERLKKQIVGQEAMDINTIRRGKDPALQKLEDYYAKRLQDMISPKGKKLLADHTIYNRIYRSQLGKNLVGTISSYCLEADGDNDYLIDKRKKQENRRKNLKSLKNEKSFNGKVVSGGYAHWASCTVRIQHICHDTCLPKLGQYTDTKSKYCCDSTCSYDHDVFKYSQTRACEVISYIKAARKNIAALGDIEKSWEKRKKTNVVGFVGEINDKINVERMTNLSSKEILKKSGYAKEQEKMVAQAEECSKNFDSKKCEKFVDDKGSLSKKLLSEYSLRSRVVQEKIDTITADDADPKGIEEYLKEEGYTKDQIAAMMKEEDIDKIKTQITNRFKKQREALHRSLKARIKKNQIDTGELESNGNRDVEKTKAERMTAVHEDLKGRTERVSELVFFNNMISGFLTWEREGEKGKITGSNSAILYHELKDSVFEDTGRDPAQKPEKEQIDFQGIKKNAQRMVAKPPAKKNNDEDVGLSVENINESLLNYKTDSSEKDL